MPHCCPRSLLVVAFAAFALPAQESKVEDPALALIRGMLKEAKAAQTEGEHEDARAILRQARNACLALPGFAERKDAHDLLFEVARAAYFAADLRTANDAWERACDYRTRTLPDDHPDLQRARTNLAVTKDALGDLQGARALQEKVYEVQSRTLPDDHPDLQRARTNLAVTKDALGDLQGAHALHEKVYEVRSRTLPDDHPDLQWARNNLAGTMDALGDLHGARALREKVYEVCSRTLPDDHPDLQWARANLANTKGELGDLQGARALEEKVYEVRSRTLPDDHPDLQRARGNLAATMLALGDLQDARALQEKVYEVQSRTLPDDHPDLQLTRANLAATRNALGDLQGAHALHEKVYEVESRTLPDEHPDLQAARNNLAVTMHALGDLQGARALQEKVYEVFSRTLPDDHPNLQMARHNLADTKHALGDLEGARALQEKVYEVFSRTLPDDHPDLQRARANLAVTKNRLGDLEDARALREKVYEVQSRSLPDNHLDLQAARHNLAGTMHALGDLEGARALREKVYEVCSRALPDDHPDLQRARANLAGTKHALGDLEGARALEEKVYEVQSRTLPDDHPDLQAARGNLATIKRALGDASGALHLARERSDAARRRVTSWTLAPRERGAMAAQEQQAIDQLLTLAGGTGALPAQLELTGDALATSQTLRGVQTRAARGGRRARVADPQRAATLENELRAAAAEVSRVAGKALEGEGEALEANRRDRAERLSRAVHDKERLERELAALAAKAGHVATASARAAELAAALPERSAAAAIVGFKHSSPDSEHPGRMIDEARLTALVLDRQARVRLVPLARTADVQSAIETVRNGMLSQAARGLRPGTSPANEADQVAGASEKLRASVITPLLDACGPIETLYVAVDDLLELVPLDALPLDAKHLVGEQVALRPLVSLLDLLEPDGPPVTGTPGLMIGGGIDYRRAAEDAAMLADSGAASPVLERAGEDGLWTQLPGTVREAAEIATLFAQAFPQGQTERFAGEHAGKAQIAQAAPRATFVHLATHGYFAPENVKSTADAAPGEGAITGLSPLVLCGLALSGANLPPDDLGRYAGILTAEEILSLDLSRCFLVTLSACDTSLGVRRAGQGYASLRAALQGAGARFVLTSLWKVGDEATMELMVDFYRRLWVQKKEPHQALWEAKMAARRKGAPFRDWAGWVLTGR